MCSCYFKQKTAYEMHISDWSSDVCSSDRARRGPQIGAQVKAARAAVEQEDLRRIAVDLELVGIARRERGDNAIGEEVAVAPEPGEEVGALRDRSEERRVGKGCGRTCRTVWAPIH